VTLRLLGSIRYASILGICLLAGYYASTLVFAPDAQPPVAVAAADTTAAPGPATPFALLTLPDIRLKDLNGDLRALSDWSGQPRLINFWATWCAPCLREMPMLEALSQARSDGSLAIIGIAIDRLAEVRPYIDKTGVTYPILVGQSDAMEAAQSFGDQFAGLPFTVFAAADGQILGVHSGELHPDQLEEIMGITDAVAAGTLSVAEARQRLAD